MIGRRAKGANQGLNPMYDPSNPRGDKTQFVRTVREGEIVYITVNASGENLFVWIEDAFEPGVVHRCSMNETTLLPRVVPEKKAKK